MANESPSFFKYETENIFNETMGDNLFTNMLEFVSNPNPDVNHPFDYLPGLLILITLFTIVFLSLKARGASTQSAFFSASLVNLIVTILLFPLNVISGLVLTVSIVIFVISIGIVWFVE